MRKMLLCAGAMTMALALAGCGGKSPQGQAIPPCLEGSRWEGPETSREENQGIGAFSYTEERAGYGESSPGVRYEGFRNVSQARMDSIQGVIERACRECTVEYDTVRVDYDGETDMWKVTCMSQSVAGGCQSIYLDGDGVTRMIVYGE